MFCISAGLRGWRPRSSGRACPLWDETLSVEVLFTGLYLFWSLSGNCFLHVLRGVMGDRSRESRHLDEEAAWNQGDGPVPIWATSPGGAEGEGSAVSQTHVLPCKKKRAKEERMFLG